MISLHGIMYGSTIELMDELDRRIGVIIDEDRGWDVPRGGLAWMIVEGLDMHDELDELPLAFNIRPKDMWLDRASEVRTTLERYMKVCERVGAKYGNIRRWCE